MGEDVGACSHDERVFNKPVHDLIGTATTRALNRATSNLVGLGELSAEELASDGERRVRGIGAVEARVAGVEQGLPAVRSAGVPRKSAIRREQSPHGGDVADRRGGVDARSRELRMLGEELPGFDPAREMPLGVVEAREAHQAIGEELAVGAR